MNISDFLVIQSREMGEMVEGGGVVIIMVRGEDRPVVYDNVTPWSSGPAHEQTKCKHNLTMRAAANSEQAQSTRQLMKQPQEAPVI